MQPSPARQTTGAALPGQDPSRRPESDDSDLFLYCCICFQPLSSPPTQASDGEDDDRNPFWLTSCGHITCGAHIFPEGAPAKAARSKHTCPYCQSGEVSITRLGVGETPAYLQDYFRPTNELLNDFYGAMTSSNTFQELSTGLPRENRKAQSSAERGKGRAGNGWVVEEVPLLLIKSSYEVMEKILTRGRENESLKEELEKLRSMLRKYESSSVQGVQISSNTLSEPKQASQTRLPSPQATIPQKRKSPHQEADTLENSATLERRFREEFNARQAMPPPRVKLHRGQNSVHGSLPPETPVYQRDSQGQSLNIYTPIQKPQYGVETHQLESEQQEHNLRGLNRTVDSSLSNFHREGEQISDNAHRTKRLESQTNHTMRVGSTMRYYPMSSSTSFPSQRSPLTAASQQVPPTPSRPSFSRSVNAPFQPPTLARLRPPQQISPFMDGLMSRGAGGSLRLSTAETSKSVYQSNRSSSPLERLSLPPKPVMRNPPRGSARQNPPNTSLSSPFFREQVSSGGSHSSHTLRGTVQNLQSSGELNLAYEGSNFPTISLDSGGLFRRGNLTRSDADFRVGLARSSLIWKVK
ncbi:hypothetical protein EV426DRAFT_643520 [Tirmania nivea]|nr:hypothetical protein EV426DRAFT_643520 [Tirmania nivea]